MKSVVDVVLTYKHYLQIRNDKARRYLSNMRKKPPVPFSQKFPNVDPLALRLLERLLAFDPKDRPSAEEVKIWWWKLISQHEFKINLSSEGRFMSPQMLLISLCLLLSGTSWSVLPRFGQCGAWTIHAAHLKTWVWVWKEEIDKRWCPGINLQRGSCWIHILTSLN